MINDELKPSTTLATIPLANPTLVHGWIDEAGLALPYPSDEDCYTLSRELQIAVNRSNNTVLEVLAGGEIPLFDMKDVDPTEIIRKRWGEMMSAANNLAFYLERLLDFSPELDKQEGEGISKLQQGLALISAYSEPIAPPSKPQRGRRREPWHSAGRAIAPTIQALLRRVGYNGRIGKTDNESPTAIIGAAAISWAYDRKVQAEGFASAMRHRDRKVGSPNP